jgi:hypothetical protein
VPPVVPAPQPAPQPAPVDDKQDDNRDDNRDDEQPELIQRPDQVAHPVSLPTSGVFQLTRFSPAAPPRRVGRLSFLKGEIAFAFQQSLDGSFEGHIRVWHQGAWGQPAPEVFDARGTFTGTVGGVHGTFTCRFHGDIDAAGHDRGVLTILHGSGDLANLHGSLTVTGQARVGGAYAGVLFFAR